MFRMRLMVLAAAAIVASPAAAADTLEDALVSAYRNNPTIRAERARLRATEELKAQAFANALPQVTAQGSYSSVENTQTRNPSIFGPGGTDTVNLNPLAGEIVAEQPLFTGFRNLNAIRQARARVRAGGAQLAGVEQDVLQRVATSYLDVVRDLTIFKSTQNNVEVLLRQKREAELRFEVGEVTKTDVAQAEARLQRARSDLARSQAQLAASRAIFAELVGEAPGELAPVAALPQTPDSIEAALTLAREYAPGVVAARETEAASRRGVAIARGALSPTVSAVASYSYAEEPNTFLRSDETFSYGVRASVPIFRGGLNLSRVREARALADAAAEQVEVAERRAEAAAVASWEALQAARITIMAARAQVAANELALEGVRRESQLGVRTTLDVLDAEQELLNARVSLANAEHDEGAAVFSVLQAAGVLTPDAVGVDAARLNAEGTEP